MVEKENCSIIANPVNIPTQGLSSNESSESFGVLESSGSCIFSDSTDSTENRDSDIMM